MGFRIKNAVYAIIYMYLFVLTLPFSAIAQLPSPPGTSKKILITEYLPFWTLPSQDELLPHTLRLVAQETGIAIPDSLYRLEGTKVIWTAPVTLLPLPLEIAYRVYPEWLVRMRRNLDPVDSSGPSAPAGRIYSPYQDAGTLIHFRKAAYSGSFSRGISAGNRQDLALQSSFNLQLAGDLGDELEVLAAISDAQLPLQPEGNSLQLRDFDRIFVQLSRAGKQLTAGDIDLKPEDGSYFLHYYNRLQGAQYRQTYEGGGIRAATAVARGRFVRYALTPEEGNQGPYPLRGAGGERFIVILAGTEQVFLNGQLLQRGFDQDYIMDYNRGEITFMPRRQVTRESRIVAEYEYAAQDFLRSIIALDAVREAKNLRAYAQIYSLQDSRNPGPGLNLSEQDALLLRAAGDNPEKALISGIQRQENFSPSRVLYAMRDTLNGCGGRDSVLVYSTDAAVAIFSARFTYVGEGRGHYTLGPMQSANERIYLWVGLDPLTCIPRGDYEPVVKIAPPRQQQMAVLGQVWSPDARTSLRSEIAFSRLDLNRLSRSDSGDDFGWAAFADFNKKYVFHPAPDSWSLSLRSTIETLHADFRTVNPYRNPEFLRDWSLAGFQGIGSTAPSGELHATFTARLEHPGTGELSYSLQSFLRKNLYRGRLHQVQWDLKSGNWQFRGSSQLNYAEQEQESARFLRPMLELGKIFPQLGNWRFATSFEGESNRRSLPGSDSLTVASFAFYRYQFSLESPEKEAWQWQARYMRRSDYLPDAGKWEGGPDASEFSISGRWQKQRTRLQGVLNYRQLKSDIPITQPTGAVFLGRIESSLQLLKGLVRSTNVYETGTGQEPRREFTFIKVAPGEGAYIWLDSLYNRDGVIQFYEMENAPFADQADYIRVSAIGSSFVRSNYASINQSLHLEPGNLIKDTKSIAARGLSKISGQFSWRLHQKHQIFPGTPAPIQNPFVLNPADSALISLNAGIRQMIVFNRAHPRWELQWARNRSDSKLLQTAGFETRHLEENTLQLRWNWATDWTFRPLYAFGHRGSNSEAYSARDVYIAFHRAEAQIAWLSGPKLRLQGKYRYQSDKNTLLHAPYQTYTHDLGIETTYNPAPNTALQLRSSLINIRYIGNPRSPVGFALLNGLQAGRNILWEISLDRQIARGMQLRFGYEGRKTGNNAVAHIGRAQVTAIF